MRIKNGVKVEGVQPQVWYAIGIAEQVYRDLNSMLVVTSLTDGEHKKGSLHYKGLAADFRIRDFSQVTKERAIVRLKYLLEPQGYDVILEADHFHIEYDPKKGETWQITVG